MAPRWPTGWGYKRILGELKKLRIYNISRATIARILKENGFDPGPKRGDGTWHDFMQRHIKTVWATDFFTKTVRTVGSHSPAVTMAVTLAFTSSGCVGHRSMMSCRLRSMGALSGKSAALSVAPETDDCRYQDQQFGSPLATASVTELSH